MGEKATAALVVMADRDSLTFYKKDTDWMTVETDRNVRFFVVLHSSMKNKLEFQEFFDFWSILAAILYSKSEIVEV